MGKGTGRCVASGIFTFAHPANPVQRQYNKEALRLLEVRRCQLLLDQQAIGLGVLPRMRFKANFLEFYREYVHYNRRRGNRHLEASFTQFKIFIWRKYLPPIEVTEALSTRFRGYLLDKFNGDTPANYFSRFKNVIKTASMWQQVALLLGHTSTKYVLNTYKRFRPKDPWQAILKLPTDN